MAGAGAGSCTAADGVCGRLRCCQEEEDQGEMRVQAGCQMFAEGQWRCYSHL